MDAAAGDSAKVRKKEKAFGSLRRADIPIKPKAGSEVIIRRKYGKEFGNCGISGKSEDH